MREDNLLVLILSMLLISGLVTVGLWQGAYNNAQWKPCDEYSITEYKQKVIPVRCEGKLHD